MTTIQSGRGCKIELVGKNRRGQNRYWCTVHHAPASGRYGQPLNECEGAYLAPDRSNELHLKQGEYPGGIGLWGAVKPVYDSTTWSSIPGVHVHAREIPDGKKLIDETFSDVRLSVKRDLIDYIDVTITAETAVSYYISRSFGIELTHLFCVHCATIHLDAGYFAIHPHRKHLCHGCGREFYANEKTVSNPIHYIQYIFKDAVSTGPVVRAERSLSVRQADFGGLQVWASNPALMWTARRPEQEGIHVHAYDMDGKLVEDETFHTVTLDGITLNEEWLRVFMAQQALKDLEGRIVQLECPECRTLHFDKGLLGFEPHCKHECEGCGSHFSTRSKVISNPFLGTIVELKNARSS